MTYRPGELDQQIDLLSNDNADDDMGGSAANWTAYAEKVWAKARALSGKELERYDQVNATAMVTFVIRYRGDIKPEHAIRWMGDLYNIRYVPPLSGRAMYMAIEAEKGVAI